MSEPQSPRDFRHLRQWLPPTSLSGLKQELNDLFEGFFQETVPAWRGDGPRVDIVETPQNVEVTVDLPGWNPADVDVDVSETEITIAGKHASSEESAATDRRYHRAERKSASFSRTVWLPCPVNMELVQAEMTNGVLHVRIPKREAAHQGHVRIKPNASPPPGVG